MTILITLGWIALFGLTQDMAYIGLVVTAWRLGDPRLEENVNA